MSAFISNFRIYVTIFWLTFCIFFLFTSESPAQTTDNGKDDIYGWDPLLYNGRYYNFFSPLNARGNQFLNERQFESGRVTIRGITYRDLNVNYDICNQQLLLEYADKPGIVKLIVVSDAWLERFSISNRNFRILQDSDNGKRICQEIGNDQYRILYFWKKYMQMDYIAGSRIMTFSRPYREMNLLINGKTSRFWNNKSFINLFPPENKVNIKVYFRNHHINVKNASDMTMAELINYCNTFEDK